MTVQEWINAGYFAVTGSGFGGIVGAGVWSVKKINVVWPKIKTTYEAIHWVYDHLKTNAEAQQVVQLADQAAATADPEQHDLLIKSAVQEALAALGVEIQHVDQTYRDAITKYVVAVVPETVKPLVTQLAVDAVLQLIAYRLTVAMSHEAILAAQTLKKPSEKPMFL